MKVTKLIIVLTTAFLPFLGMAQTDIQEGIKFESGLSLQQILDKAKAENKCIFFDCYATWCGPCKWMTSNIFSDKVVGDFMNTHFINVAVQMDKTAKDDQQVRDWYADATSMHDYYKVGAYPTYLFFSPDGKALHRFTGTRDNIQAFLDDVNDVFDPAKQYYSTMKEWKSNKSDTTFLYNAYNIARKQRESTLADSIGKAYLKIQPNLFTRSNMRIIGECNLIQSSKDKWFELLLNNTSRIDGIMTNQNWAEERLSRIIFEETIFSLFEKNGEVMDWKEISSSMKANYPAISKKLITISERLFRDRILRVMVAAIPKDSITLTEVDWLKIIKKLNKRFPGYDYDQILLQKQADYYADKQLWSICTNATYALIKRYGDKIGDRDINNLSWNYVFLHSADSKILSEASKWMKRSIDSDPDRVVSVDTYANLLYKLGKREEALTWENKAVATAVKNHIDPRDLNDFNMNLAKMQQGQSTWGN